MVSSEFGDKSVLSIITTWYDYAYKVKNGSVRFRESNYRVLLVLVFWDGGYALFVSIFPIATERHLQTPSLIAPMQ